MNVGWDTVVRAFYEDFSPLGKFLVPGPFLAKSGLFGPPYCDKYMHADLELFINLLPTALIICLSRYNVFIELPSADSRSRTQYFFGRGAGGYSSLCHVFVYYIVLY